jgi:asparagine synthase (glutamine-hydrolysing)
MCGIAGALALRTDVQLAALRDVVEQLVRRQAHRGPDAEGIWDDGNRCALGHRRLAVIDLTPGGAQPMTDASGRFCITYNGEIYNFGALRTELESLGHAFRSRSDTEVLLAAYAEWGDEAFVRLDGMFGLAIYDRTERSLVLARDRVGEKPLHYARLGGMFVLSSELRAIAALPGVGAELDENGVFDYLALRYVPAPRTILRGVRSLEPGTIVRIHADGSESRLAFHVFDRAVDPITAEPEALADELENALTESLKRRLIADVPLGAFLSSGIDSSLVCALAARRLGRELQTFCAGFAGVDDDESAASSRVAAALGMPHQTYTLSSDDMLSAAGDFARQLDEPNGDRSCVPVYLLAREMRRNVTVAISGDGGDELFCGYERYAAFRDARCQAGAAGAAEALELYFEKALPVFPPSVLKRIFPEEHAQWRERFLQPYLPVFMRAGWNEPQRLSVLDYHTYLPGAVLSKVDRMSMRHALEVRTPFFDPKVLELAAGLPSSWCGADGSMKPLLRRVLRRHLPEDLISARKVGFGMPASFIQAHIGIFSGMFHTALEALRATRFFSARSAALDLLAAAAPRNINSLWATTVLGGWVATSGLRL